MTLPDGYAFRPAKEDDLESIDGLLQAYDVAQLGFADPSIDQLRDDFRVPGFDPERDTWFVTSQADGSLAGFVLYTDAEPGEEGSQGFGRVHPDHQRRGLGAFLVDAVDERWRSSAAREPVIRHYLNAGDAEAASLLSSRGYELVRREYHLERPLTEVPAPVIPDGIQLRPLRPGEERALHALNEDAFAEHWGFRSSTFEEWNEVFRLDSLEPGSVWVAAAGGELVGELIVLVQENGGWVEVVGVRRPWRGRGIGRALLRTGFAELARRGCGSARLGVDVQNETGALDLYLSEGMTVRREWHVVEKTLG